MYISNALYIVGIVANSYTILKTGTFTYISNSPLGIVKACDPIVLIVLSESILREINTMQ